MEMDSFSHSINIWRIRALPQLCNRGKEMKNLVTSFMGFRVRWGRQKVNRQLFDSNCYAVWMHRTQEHLGTSHHPKQASFIVSSRGKGFPSVQSSARASARLGGEGGRVGVGPPVGAVVYLSVEE